MTDINSLINAFREKLKEAIEITNPTFEDIDYLEVDIKIEDNVSLLKKDLSYGAKARKSLNKVNITLYPFEEEHMIQGILAREAFNLFLPVNIKNLNPAKDLGWEFARLSLKPKNREKWVNLWKECSKELQVDSIKYDAPFDFPLYSEVTKGDFLKDILQNFRATQSISAQLTVKEYVKTFIEYYQDYTYKFDSMELRILNYLKDNPTATAREIAKVFGMPYSKVYRKLFRLKRLQILTQRKKISYSKIGLIIAFVWANKIKEKDPPYRNLLKCRSLFSIFNYFDGGGGAVFTFAFPKNKDNLNSFRKKIDRLSKYARCEGCFIKRFQPSKTYITQSFSLLLEDKGIWQFNTATWKRWVLNYFKKDIIDLVSGMNIDIVDLRNVPLYKFSDLEMDVIKEIYNRNFSVRAIAKRLKKSPNSIEDALKRLRQLGVVKDFVRVHYLGLSSIVFLYMHVPEELVLPVVASLKEFPYTISYIRTDEPLNEIMTFIRLSPQIENKVMSALYDVFNPRLPHFEMHVGRYVYWGSYKIPFDLLDAERKSWKACY